MNQDERFYALALTLCEGIGHINAKRLIEEVGSATAVFDNRLRLKELIPEVSEHLIQALDNPSAFKRAEQEMHFMERQGITCLTLQDESYPSRLRECEDAPAVLFYKGQIDFNRLHLVAIVGTRRATQYGKDFCDKFVGELSQLCPDAVIVSGLAYGIDICSHRAAIANKLATVAVLAHGLDRIYPPQHRAEALEMQKNGGILTEYMSETNPDPFNFVARNRIVAGMTDATVVVESAQKGGSLITASLANTYNRDCFAVPGRIHDEYSKGCNKLIQNNQAVLITSAADFVNVMGWQQAKRPQAIQRDLFVSVTPEEQQIADILQARGDMHVNTLTVEANLPIYKLTTILFNLEMKGVVKALVGGIYHLLA